MYSGTYVLLRGVKVAKKLEELFIREKPVRIIREINNPQTDNYASQISKQADCTYSHTVRLLQKFEDKNVVNSNKRGRKKELELTDKGENIAKTLSDLLQTCKK